MIKGSIGRVGLATLLATAAAAPAIAQTAASPAAAPELQDNPDIVVTAQKRSQSLSDVPISITAQTGQQLVDKGISDIQGLTRITPGLSFVDSGRGVPVLSLRGVGFFDQSIGGRPTVSVYADEAPLPFSQMGRAASFDLERVEVLKGPQGTLFGQSSTGGAINYIAAKPTSQFSAGVNASFGRFDTLESQGYVSGPVTSTLKGRIAVNVVEGGDRQFSYTRPNDTIGSQDFLQGRILFDWRPTARLRIQTNVNGFRDKGELLELQLIGVRRPSAATAPLVAYPAAPRSNRAVDFNPNRNYGQSNRFYQGVLRADYDVFDAMTLTSLTTYSHLDVDIPTDGDGTSLPAYDQQLNGSARSFSEELRASGDVGGLHYLVGGNYARDHTNEVNAVDQTVANGSQVNGQPLLDKLTTLLQQSFRTYAAFADATYSVVPGVRLTAGVRYTKQELAYNGCLRVDTANAARGYTSVINGYRAANNLPPIGIVAVGQCVTLDTALLPARAFGQQNEDNVSWRLGVDFKPVRGTLVYFNVNRGYKSGSAPAPGATAVAQFNPAKQESVTAYELGTKSALFNHKVDVTAAAFYYDYKDKQLLGRAIYQPNVFGAVTALVNVPKSRVYGAEAQVTVRPIHGMTLSGAATYLNTKVQSSFSNYSIIGQLLNFKDSPFPYTPKWQFTIDGEHRVPLSATLMGTVGGTYSYRTSTIAGFGRDPRLAIDSYGLLDLRAGIEALDGAWRLQAFGRNVTGKYYWTNVSVGADAIRRLPGTPATYGVQASYRF